MSVRKSEQHQAISAIGMGTARMSAFGGKADVRELPFVCLLIARSGHRASFTLRRERRDRQGVFEVPLGCGTQAQTLDGLLTEFWVDRSNRHGLRDLSE